MASSASLASTLYGHADLRSFPLPLLPETVYFGRAIPWIIIDSMPSMRKYKLQEDKTATPAQQWKCTKYVLLTHFTVELPQVSRKRRASHFPPLEMVLKD